MPKDVTRQCGFTLVELMVSVAIASMVVAATLTFFSNVKRTVNQESLAATVETNLRWSMNALSDNLRFAGYGVPDSPSGWVPWVAGFTSNPQVIPDPGGGPDTLRLARCTSRPVATVAADGAFATLPPTLTLTSAAMLDANNRRLIFIDDEQSAWVTAVNDETVTLDTDPVTVGNQPPSRGFPAGTPLCRVEVLTFDVDTNNRQLRVDKHDGAGPQVLLDGIDDLRVATLAAGSQYRVSVTARSLQPLPGGGGHLTRSLSSVVEIRGQ